MKMTSQREVRAAFWQIARPPFHVKRRGFSHNNYPAETRFAFNDYVDALARSGRITENLASKVTL